MAHQAVVPRRFDSGVPGSALRREVCYECGYIAVGATYKAALAGVLEHERLMKHPNSPAILVRRQGQP